MSSHSGLSSPGSSGLHTIAGRIRPPATMWVHAIVLQNFRWNVSSNRHLQTQWRTFQYCKIVGGGFRH
jgi:hypothetical protein